MYFKALEMRGFKSFPERTVLTFDKPLTAIVGPNGSGKSNIADAIQWVMGEQSTKALRGGKMEDVIFGGTEKRGQVGYAEVSLTLDNTDRRLAGDVDEVQVTRRYYRSGESEYYINKKPVRLKDINELFMDTGLGRDGYSIFGQGKIDSILSARSTDRREIFEEAAGISRFRHRKEESERKLERADEDLLRVNDKIAELELQVEPLRRQSEVAKKYLLLRDELRGLEISLWMCDLESIAERTKALREESLRSAGELERAKAELEKLYSAGELFAQRMREKDMEAEGVREQVTGLEQEASEEESRAAVIRTSIEHTGENIARIEDELRLREDRRSGLTRQIDERLCRIGEIREEQSAIAARLDELKAESGELENSERQEEETIFALRKSAEEINGRLSALGLELSSITASAQEIEERRAALEGESGAEKERLKAALRDMEENGAALEKARESVDSLANVCRGYELRAEGLRRRAEEAAERCTRAQMDYNAAASRRQMLEDMEREYEGYSKAVKVVMRDADRGLLRGVHGPAGELVSTGAQYALAIETALGGAVQNIVVGTDIDGKNVINHLKRTDAGRVTLLPMNVIRGSRLNERGLSEEEGFEGLAIDLVTFDEQYRDIFLNLLGRTAVADTLDSAVRISRRFGHKFRVVTLDGQVINAGGSMTGGSASRNTGILSRASELKSLTGQVEQLSRALDTAREKNEELKRSLNAASYELSVASDERREAENTVLKLTSEARHYELLVSSLRQRIEELEREYEAVGTRREDSEARVRAIREETGRHEDELGKIQSKIDIEESARAALTSRREEIAREESGLRERRASLTSEAEGAERTVDELGRLREELSGDRQAQELALTQLHEKADELEGERALREESAVRLRAEAAALRERILAITEEKLKIEAERSKSDKLLQEKNNALLDLERAASRLDNRLEAAAMEEKQIIDKLWDGYNLTRSAAMEQRIQLSSIPQAKRRTGELKREMGVLGAPNLGAIEEFERVNSRYTYLTDQRDDIDKARRELLGIIRDITGSMETIFMEEFEKINQGFQQTFLELFGGGRASLSLEDPEDVLGSGIEIKVQPPGKTLKTITLLSGGEKAFVAIALYFAILKVRPTPFVVMDEIEAALDDANVVRVAEYMRSLAVKTQFLTITHRRGTMEEADVLYGVTMQEQGVSKVLVIDLDEAESAIGK